VAIPNPVLLSSNETEAHPGIKSWKKHESESDQRQRAIGGIIFTKKLR
jgi:hypothetical protein